MNEESVNILDNSDFVVVDECVAENSEEEGNEKPKANSKEAKRNDIQEPTTPVPAPALIKKPLIHVAFSTRSTFDSHRESFLRFMESKLKTFGSRNLKVKENAELYTIDIVDKSAPSSIFMVDKTPTSKQTSIDVPNYATNTDVLDHNSKETSEKKKLRSNIRQQNTCFNCDGAHSIRDCSKPKNQAKINKARESFNKRAERYHCDIEQKFGHLMPGKLSDGLREALGLSKYDLPNHTYIMRVIGYPPGWLEDAKITHSGLTLFDSNGQIVIESDESEGEIENLKDKYDAEKLIDFPGFNIDPPKGTVDKSSKYGFSPMMPCNRKEAMIATLQDNLAKGYKRRKLKMNSLVNQKSDSVELITADMEIDDDDATPLDITINLEETKEENSDANQDSISDVEIIATTVSVSDASSRPESPSIETLKRRHQELLADLEAAGANTSIDEDASTVEEEVVASKVRKIEYGTPILESFTPYFKLPMNEQFSKGVSDVINFENLPDSTGKYEKMKSLISKVREHAAKSNGED